MGFRQQTWRARVANTNTYSACKNYVKSTVIVNRRSCADKAMHTTLLFFGLIYFPESPYPLASEYYVSVEITTLGIRLNDMAT